MQLSEMIRRNLGWNRILLILLGVALVVRLWGITYGLPFSYWTDEYHEVMRAMELGAGSFNFARSSKGGFYFLLFFEYGVYYVFLKLTGVVANTREFAELFARDPSAFYLMGRATAALFGAITVAAVFCLARRAYSTAAGLIAALFLAMNVLHVELSHRIGVDIPMAMLATFALYFGSRVATDGRRADYVFAALFAALATTTKLPGILVLLPLLIAHTYAVAGRSGGVREWIASRDLWIAGAIFALVLVATNPGILVQTGYLSLFSSAQPESIDPSNVDEAPDRVGTDRPNLYFFYLGVLLDSMGWPVFVLSLIGVGYALWRRAPADTILVSYAALNFVVISGTSSETLYYPRYSLPILVTLAVLAGRALADLLDATPRWRRAVATIMLLACVTWPASQAIVNTYALTQTDTRTLAKEWFEAKVPTHSAVLIEGGKIASVRETMPIQESVESMKRRVAHWEAVEPRQARFLELKLAGHEGGGYALELVSLDSLASLDDYASTGVEYFVVRPDYFVGSRKRGPEAARLLHELRTDPRARLLRRFAPESKFQLGPVIEIYQLQSDAAIAPD